jgi:hypothetical protein
MAVTYRLRKQAVPYKTRLTGRLMPFAKAFSSEVEFRFAQRKRALLKMRGSAQHAGPLAMSCINGGDTRFTSRAGKCEREGL